MLGSSKAQHRLLLCKPDVFTAWLGVFRDLECEVLDVAPESLRELWEARKRGENRREEEREAEPRPQNLDIAMRRVLDTMTSIRINYCDISVQMMNYCDYLALHADEPLWWTELIAVNQCHDWRNGRLDLRHLTSSVVYSLLGSGAHLGVSTHGLSKMPRRSRGNGEQKAGQPASISPVYVCNIKSLESIIASISSATLVWELKGLRGKQSVRVHSFRTHCLPSLLYSGPTHDKLGSGVNSYLSFQPNQWIHRVARSRLIKDIGPLIRSAT